MFVYNNNQVIWFLKWDLHNDKCNCIYRHVYMYIDKLLCTVSVRITHARPLIKSYHKFQGFMYKLARMHIIRLPKNVNNGASCRFFRERMLILCKLSVDDLFFTCSNFSHRITARLDRACILPFSARVFSLTTIRIFTIFSIKTFQRFIYTSI